MPDEVFWPGQSRRDHVVRVAEQAQGGAKEKAESSKKIPRLSDQEFSFFNAAYKARTAATRSQPSVWKKTQASIDNRHQTSDRLSSGGCVYRELHP
jgi:hypothetical protein